MAGTKLTQREMDEVDNVINLDLGGTARNQSATEVKRYETALKDAALHGWLADVPDVLFTLRGVSTTNLPSDRDDDRKTLIALMANEAYKLAATDAQKLPKHIVLGSNKEITAVVQCNNDTRCDTTPITHGEVNAAIGATSRPTQAMNAKRGLRVSHRGAAEIGFIDAIFSPEGYTTTGGKSHEDIAATVANMFKKHPRKNIMGEFEECTVAVSGDPLTCTQAGARMGMLFQFDHPEMQYEGSKFVGSGNVPSASAPNRKTLKNNVTSER